MKSILDGCSDKAELTEEKQAGSKLQPESPALPVKEAGRVHQAGPAAALGRRASPRSSIRPLACWDMAEQGSLWRADPPGALQGLCPNLGSVDGLVLEGALEATASSGRGCGPLRKQAVHTWDHPQNAPGCLNK